MKRHLTFGSVRMDPLPLLIFPGRKLKAQHTAFSPQKIAAVEELRSESSGTAALISSHLPSLEECMRTTSEYFSIQLFIILERTNSEHVELWTYLVTEHTLGRHFIVMCFNALYLESFSSSSVFNDFAFAFVLFFPQTNLIHYNFKYMKLSFCKALDSRFAELEDTGRIF